VATAGGYLDNFVNSSNNTHITTKDINDVNYITEGFLSRFQFKFEKKHSSLFGSILKGVAIGIGVVALAAATVFTCGAAGAIVAGATLAASVAAGAAAVGTALAAVAGVVGVSAAMAAVVVTGGVAVGTAATLATLGAVQELRYGLGRTFAKVELNGRKTECPSGYEIKESSESRLLK
jgi:hypothetical protein